ncbi:MAG: ABC transporter substrate-binding protein [Beijerinckiaceae bacterium]
MSLKLRIGLDRYDRHLPFFDGTAKIPGGLDVQVDQIGQSSTLRDGRDRHARMVEGVYDVAEFSMSSYLIARAQGLPIIGIPVFPRRLFSAGQMWVHPDSNLWKPADLIGKKVALSTFQTTLSLLAKGDLKFHYGVPWEEIHWLTTTPEVIDVPMKPGVKVDFIGNRQRLGEALEKGEIDAFFLPHPPKSVSLGKTRARRLFKDTRAEELEYFRRVGVYPIMHVIVVREEIAASNPWLPMALYAMFEDARDLAREYYEDPNYSMLAWGRLDFEEEMKLFGRDPWENGFARNRENVARFIRYSHDQGLIPAPYGPETLFHPATLET